MVLKHRTKIYFALEDNLMQFAAEQSQLRKMTKAKWLAALVEKEFELVQKKKIELILNGGQLFEIDSH